MTKSIAEPQALAREPVEVWRPQPRVTAFFPLLPLHDGQGIKRLVVRINKEQVRPASWSWRAPEKGGSAEQQHEREEGWQQGAHGNEWHGMGRWNVVGKEAETDRVKTIARRPGRG